MANRFAQFIEQHSTVIMVGLLFVALVLGLREAVLTGNVLKGFDSADYDNMGTNLLAGRGFVREGTGSVRGETLEFRLRGHRPPIYPLFLALLYRLFGHDFRVVYVAQALIYGLAGYVLYRAALYCFGRQGPALLTLLLYALYPPLQGLARQVSTEIPFTLFLVLQLFFLVRWARNGSSASLVLSALSVAAATLTRPSSFLLPVFMFLFFLAVPTLTRAARVRAFAVYVLVYVAAISPWMVRQAAVFHEFVPVTTGGGITLWEGAGPAEGRTAIGWAQPGVPDETFKEFRDLFVVGRDGYSQELALDKLARKKGLEIVRNDPAHYVWLTLVKVPKFWLGIDFESKTPLGTVSPKRVVGLAMGAVVLVMAVIGAVSLARRRAYLFLAPAAIIVYFTLLHMFLYVLQRYSLPVHPLVMLFSAAGLVAVLERWQGRGSGQEPANPLERQ